MKLLFVAVVAVAAVSALVGQGGGIFYTPLQLWMGIPFHQAAATSLVLILAGSGSAALVFRKAQRIDWRLVATIEPPTMIGGFAGGFVSHHVPAWVLEALLGVVLLSTALLVLRETPLRLAPAAGSLSSRPFRGGSLRVLPLMFMVGGLTGALGIGGGVLKVPIMILLMGARTETAIASSAVMVGLTALAGIAGHASVGHLQWRIALVLAGAAVVGAQLGSRVSLSLPTPYLRRVLGVVQIAVGLLVLVGVLC
jgi:uncharacterized membrane protein YfcA